MGKKVVLAIAIMLALPIAALADSDISFASSGGMLVGNSLGMSVSGAQLVSITGLDGTFTGTNLGTLSFATDSFAPGANSVITGANYRAGGSVNIVGNGSDGAPAGVLFSGAFTTNPSWTRVTTGGQNIYTFSGIATGNLANGSSAEMLIQFTLNKGTGIFPGTSALGNVTATAISVPEPGSLGLMGSGFAGLLGMIWRKRRELLHS